MFVFFLKKWLRRRVPVNRVVAIMMLVNFLLYVVLAFLVMYPRFAGPPEFNSVISGSGHIQG
jgi:hypothetical protein